MTDAAKPTIELGDTVRILPHITGPSLYPNIRYPHPAAGIEHVVERKPYDWKYLGEKLQLRRLVKDGADYALEWVHPSNLKLVHKGSGDFIEGVSVPFSQRELADQRLEAFRKKFSDTPVPECEGFANAATFLAWLYLNNEPRFHHSVPNMWRKDGSINPGKVQKEFGRLKLVVDDWAFQSHIETPEEYKRHWMPGQERLQVNWTDVALMFHRGRL